ncbi:hypothetical protein AALP_AA2G035800 [Arabis alpina]|uniref:BTB domain-containing protein n=1 Tax=Arabis alpina TaxID=50452 RepID=A0A087HF45_ARAAL|nr:hypothetical protein AALP_AA2G035800 [Arabis alpina]
MEDSRNQVTSTMGNLGNNDTSFAFAFDNAHFSDPSLLLVTDVGTAKEFHVSSAILSAKSQFFFKLFSNGMVETNQNSVSLQIKADEEYAVSQMLRFMYSHDLLAATDISQLVEVLVVADKFDVSSCVTYCSSKLLLLREKEENLLEVATLEVEHTDFAFAFNQPCFSDRILSMVWGVDGDDSKLVTTKELYIASPLLSAKSAFFYKLFSDAESNQKRVILTIDESEEYALTQIIKFIYTNSLVAATDICQLVEVLVAADKFDVSSCVAYCTAKLLTFPMTKESALVYLNLPWNVLMAESSHPLIQAAKETVATYYDDLSDHPKEDIMDLPLLAIEAILSNDNLLMASETHAYNLLLAWTEENYIDPQERKDVFSSLAGCIRFAWMSPRSLEEVLVSELLNPETAAKIVLQALIFQTATTLRKQTLAAMHIDHRFVERTSYKYKPVKLVEFLKPHDQKIIYMDLTRTECEQLFPCHRRYSQGFSLAGNRLYISARCNLAKERLCLGLFIEETDVCISKRMNYEFSVRAHQTEEFIETHRGSRMTSQGDEVGCTDLLSMAWTDLMDEDSLFFIEDVLHLRVDLSIRSEDP